MNDQIEFVKKRKNPQRKKPITFSCLIHKNSYLPSEYLFYVIQRANINIQCKMGILIQRKAPEPLGDSGDGVTDGVCL